MELKRYEDSDYEVLSELYKDYGPRIPPKEALPKTGWIYPLGAIFLRRAEGGIGYIETLVVKKGEEREDVLGELLQAVHKEAKDSGMTLLVGYSRIPAVLERAIDWGFQILPHKMMVTRV